MTKICAVLLIDTFLYKTKDTSVLENNGKEQKHSSSEQVGTNDYKSYFLRRCNRFHWSMHCYLKTGVSETVLI